MMPYPAAGPDAYLERLCRSARTFLSRWQGASVEVRELHPSHKTLKLVLFRDYLSKPSSNLCIAAPEPLWISGPLSWSGGSVSIDIVSAAESVAAKVTTRERILRLQDRDSCFELYTETLEIAENVRLR